MALSPDRSTDDTPGNTQGVGEYSAEEEFGEAGDGNIQNVSASYKSRVTNRRPSVSKDVYRRARDIRKKVKEEEEAASYGEMRLAQREAVSLGSEAATRSAFGAGKGGVGVKTVGRAAARFLIFPAVVAYVFQFVLGVIAIIMLGGYALVQSKLQGLGWFGKVIQWALEAVASVVKIFVDIPEIDKIAIALWTLAFFVALCVFIGYALFFYFVSIPFMDSVLSIALLGFCIGLCLVFPLFPGTLIWLVVVLGSYTVKSTLETVRM